MEGCLKMSQKNYSIGFIGGGAMAEALMTGFIKAGLVTPEKLIASDVNEHRINHLKDKFGILANSDNAAVAEGAQIIILSVKPFVLGDVLESVGSKINQEQIVISIAAGISTQYIEKRLGDRVPVVRVMPNTPALVGEGATAVCCGKWAGEKHRELALELFGAVGRAVSVPENLMDAVTGLSGSGPAYMYVIAEALSDAGVRMGLPREKAQTLAAQTMLGAAKMILETNRHPGMLKDMVTTPAGTAIEGLLALEEGGLRIALGRAVERACHRSRQLSGQDKE